MDRVELRLVGTYHYPAPGAALPHAVASVTGTVNGAVNPHYGYDANGNMVCEFVGASCGGSGVVRESATWTAFNMAAQITQGTGSVNLTYDSEHARILQHRQFASTVEDTTYLNDPATGALEEHVVLAGTTTWRDYVQADGHVVAEKFSGATVALRYMVSDHLGSVAVLTDQTGAVVERDAYDAWGKRRNLNGSDDTACALTSQTTRGFTGHEHIDDLCLIDANARLYDPILGRFLSPDDVVPEPYDMQSLNRFSYVRNRPLSVTDPTGHDDGCAVQECAPGDGWRMGNDDDAEGGFLNITDGMGDTLPGLTSWGSNAAGATDATAGTAAPCAPIGGSKPQNDRRNAEKYWKLTHYHQNADGTQTITTEYVQGTIESDGHIRVVKEFGKPTVETVSNAGGARTAALPPGIGHNGGPPLEDMLGTGLKWGLKARLLTGIGTFVSVMWPTPLNEGEGVPTPPSFPGNPSQLQHIFRGADGHFPTDTPEAREQIQMTINQANFSHTDIHGNSIYGGLNSEGSQTWVSVRNGMIQNAGENSTPQDLLKSFP